MTLDLANFEVEARSAIRSFWNSRESAAIRQRKSGKQDTGARGAVTAGKNMDGFLEIAQALTKANGLNNAQICTRRRVLTLPGFFRPTKQWDMLVLHRRQLVAVLEFKSHVGSSFGNNFNNRCEEAIGSAHDFWTAYREGAFGVDVPRPFLGWVMLLEDNEKSVAPVINREPHFPVEQEFEGASYAQRYNLLCKRLMQEGLYRSAALVLSPRIAIKDGGYRSFGQLTSFKSFVTELAGYIATVAARGMS